MIEIIAQRALSQSQNLSHTEGMERITISRLPGTLMVFIISFVVCGGLPVCDVYYQMLCNPHYYITFPILPVSVAWGLLGACVCTFGFAITAWLFENRECSLLSTKKEIQKRSRMAALPGQAIHD
jgi:hypothetical protein